MLKVGPLNADFNLYALDFPCLSASDVPQLWHRKLKR